MPNGVANWPELCDPRMDHGGACFCSEGYYGLYPAPWQFEVRVTGAIPPNDVFNGNWLVPWISRDDLDPN